MNTGRTFALILLALLLAGSIPATAGASVYPREVTGGFREVPTMVCVCQETPQAGSSSPASFHLASPADPAPIYDEQLGTTFTQSFTSMAYNVTAVEQTDPVSGDGPAYLLNGLSNEGYWYQAGVSWDWSPGSSPGTGFAMSYEVFDPQGNSVFPSSGSGGLLSFSGTVNQGDSILLNLYFSSGIVMMVAHDWNTGASASESFSAESGTFFAGNSQANSNTIGFFTGLMTEWYHPAPYLSNEKEVIYSESNFAVTSAWLWMDEYNPNGGRGQSVFSNETGSPVSFTTSPSKLQEFSSDGATEYMDAYEFVTGAMNATAPTTVPLTLSYSVVGGGSGYSAPLLQYVSGGAATNVTLSTSPTTYDLDSGSGWSVTATLTGSTASERWSAGQQTAGNATAAQTIVLAYYNQYSATVSYSVIGVGGTAPTFTSTSFGAAKSMSASTQPTVVWVDSGSSYGMTNPLPGSNSQERWLTMAGLNGTANAPVVLTPMYYQQFLVSAKFSTIGGGNLSSTAGVYLSAPSFGSEVTTALTPNVQSLWFDAGSAYGLTQNVTATVAGLKTAVERWVTNSTGGTVGEGLNIEPEYQNQYLVSLRPSAPAAGTLSNTGGWYDAGTSLQVTPSANSGWSFEYWAPAGASAGQIVYSSGTLSLVVNGPINDTAVFYPALTVTAGPEVSVQYSFEAGNSSSTTVGSVAAGASAVVYVPPGGVKLSASTSSFLYSFGGWSGASSSGRSPITLTVDSPSSISAKSSYNYLDIAIILGAVILLIALVAALAASRSRKTVGSPAA